MTAAGHAAEAMAQVALSFGASRPPNNRARRDHAADHRGADRFNDSVIRDTVIRMTRIDVHGIWAGICAEETTEKRQRTDAAGCCSIWQTPDSIRRRPTRPTRGDGWRRMESMLERVLAKLTDRS